MLVEIKVPVFPESVSDGTIVKWNVKVGEAFECDDVLAEIETDKVVFEVPAIEDGVLAEILEQEGATVFSDQLIGKINIEQIEQKKVVNQDVTQSASSESKVTSIHAKQSPQEKILTPSANKLVKENNIDVNQIKGTGKGDRVIKEDIIHHMNKSKEKSKPSSNDSRNSKLEKNNNTVSQNSLPPEQSVRVEKRVPMTRLRARIAERLLESQHTAAILTTFNEINMAPVMELRRKYRDAFEKQHGVRLGFMSFFIKASIEALKRFPDVNASVEDKDILYHGYYDIGIAVGSPRGLVVPIIRDADQFGFADTEKKIVEFGQKAKDGSLSIDEITGGTFSITNGGVFGSLLSTPIINPPQSGILGLHKIDKRPVVVDDEIVIRPMMYVALSYDHRLIDGRGAVQFLVTIKELIEDPSRLLLEV